MSKKKLTLALMGAAMLSANALAEDMKISEVVPPSLKDYDVNGDGTINEGEKAYELKDADDLYWFADKVNNENATFGNANAFLAEDITVNENLLTDLITVDEDGTATLKSEEEPTAWTPIGDYSFQYSGIFNGNNKTISGLYFNDSGADYVGLFGYVGTVGKIQDVTIADSYFCGRACVGGVCGSNIGGSISDCSNTGDVSGVDCVGGVCGYNKSTISNCYNKGTVTGDENVGGVCGGNNGTIKNCYNTGDVTGTDDYVGGVCGYNRGTISNCYNTGSVTGDDSVGGVCGDNSLSEISNCYNTGDVSGDDCVGGVCGDNIGTITNCYNTGDVSGDGLVGGVCGFSYDGTIENCYNTGDVTATGKYTYVGGVCGENDSTISNCYNTGDVSGDGFVGGVCGDYEDGEISNCYYLADTDDENGGKTASQFASGEVCWLLNGGETQAETPAFYQTIGKDIIPVLDKHHTVIKNGESYKNNAHSYENGICTVCEDYEPATDSDGDGVYEISNAGQLYWFADKVNNDNEHYGNANAVLKNDITVNSGVLDEDGELNEGDFRVWTPIGNFSSKYSGTFDGAGYTISGLYFNVSNATYVGLFGVVGTGGKIQDVTIADSYFYGFEYVGGVCGYIENGTIEKCYNTGRVEGYHWVSGVCGDNNGTISNCYNTGDVTGTDDYVGGVCGYNGGTISNCYNTGSVTGNDYVGSVCGDNYGTISNCYNTGDVTATGEEAYVGGVCGDNESTISNCYNTGDVTASGEEASVGGICGYNCNTITNCYNIGEVSGKGSVGGVCGIEEGGTFTNCYDFKLNGGTISEYSIVVNEGYITLPTKEMMSLEDYKFDCWHANEDLTDDAITSEAEFSDVHTLYAKWVEPSDPTAIKAVESENDGKTIKTIKDGQIVIIRNGVMYDMQGRKM